jgi:hypothetical protein
MPNPSKIHIFSTSKHKLVVPFMFFSRGRLWAITNELERPKRSFTSIYDVINYRCRLTALQFYCLILLQVFMLTSHFEVSWLYM